MEAMSHAIDDRKAAKKGLLTEHCRCAKEVMEGFNITLYFGPLEILFRVDEAITASRVVIDASSLASSQAK